MSLAARRGSQVMRPRSIASSLACLLLAAGIGGTACSSGGRSAPGAQASAPPVTPLDAGVAAPRTQVYPEPPEEEEIVDPPRDRETVTIKLVAEARRQAKVFWGRKDLGVAPLEIKRPRGSGPLDLLVMAPGCLPLHTRVFTDRDETLTLRLYTDKEASALVGWHLPSP